MHDAAELIARYEDLTKQIIGVFYATANELGFGFLESVYRRAMGIALLEAGLHVDEEVAVPVHFHGQVIGAFRADLVINKVILLEFKTAEEISKSHEAQLLNYLRASDMEVGYVMSFGEKARFRRLILQNDRKRQLPDTAKLDDARQER
jgi:GxxExxY protein